MLAAAKSSPDINNYLTYLFGTRECPLTLSFTPNDFQTARCAAAIMLKNHLKVGYQTISPSTLAYIRNSTLVGLQDPSPQIRSFAGNVITEVVRQGGLLSWQELLPELLLLVGNDNRAVSPQTQEGAMSALSKVCDDNRKLLDKDYQGQRPLAVIIPKLLDFTASPLPAVRAQAIATINIFITQKSPDLMAVLDTYLARLFQIATDANSEVRRNVCRAFVLLVDVRPETIAPHMEGLVEYITTQQRDRTDPEVALDAAEFWLCVGEHDKLRSTLGPFLPRIIPVLLESMIYGEDDILMLEGGGEDADLEDKEEDLKPQFAKSKGAKGVGTATTGGDAAAAVAAVASATTNGTTGRTTHEFVAEEDNLSDGEIEEEWDPEEDEAGGDPEDIWNLRKCSAAALDVLASLFRGPVFANTLPYLKENLRHEDWPHREAAVLALGAVADGCMDFVTPNLPDLVPYLISLLNDPEPVVRQITCWTLGRYSGWASSLVRPEEKTQFFEPMMEGILMRMLDGNKKVQEAAASAFANLEEKATKTLTPYVEPIVQQFVRCFDKYKDRNMFILYDCVQTLAEHVGPGLQRADLVQLLMPALIHRWKVVSDQSRELFPLLECLSYVATALGSHFTPFAGPLFARCIRIIHQNLEAYVAAIHNEALDEPDKDFLVTSLDLLSAMIQAVNKDIGELVSSSQPRFFTLLAFCMEDANNDVRQSSYALLGDCAIYIPEQLAPFLPALMPIIVRQLGMNDNLEEEIETGFSVINNACWSCGEICYQQREGMNPYAEDVYHRLRAVILNPDVPESVHENAAIALGRLAIGCPETLAGHLGNFAEPFLDSIDKVEWTEEKDSAFVGFAKVVERNPQGLESCLPKYFQAIARYDIVLHPETETSRTLKPLFYQVWSEPSPQCVSFKYLTFPFFN